MDKEQIKKLLEDVQNWTEMDSVFNIASMNVLNGAERGVKLGADYLQAACI